MSPTLTRTAAACFVLGAALGLAACESTPAGKVTSMQSDRVALAPGSTYAWAPLIDEQRKSADPRMSNDIVHDRIKTAIEGALMVKGYRRVANPAEATLVARYHVGLEDRSETEVNSFGSTGTACGYRGCVSGWGLYGAPMVDVSTINYTQGTLIVDLVDVQTGKLAWRSTSSKRIDRDDNTQTGLNQILAEMTKTLPGVSTVATAQ